MTAAGTVAPLDKVDPAVGEDESEDIPEENTAAADLTDDEDDTQAMHDLDDTVVPVDLDVEVFLPSVQQ